MLRRLHAESAGHFWRAVEFYNVANPDFENLKHLQKPGHLLLTALSMTFNIRNVANWIMIIQEKQNIIQKNN